MSLFRPAIAVFSTPRQRWIKQSIHTLQLQVHIQQQHYQHPRTSAMLYKAVTRQKIIGRRLLSSGNMNSQNGKINNIKQLVKPATKDASRISKFWKTFSGPKPMPERWTAKWVSKQLSNKWMHFIFEYISPFHQLTLSFFTYLNKISTARWYSFAQSLQLPAHLLCYW